MKLDQPLRFERRILEKVWGGRALEKRPGFALPTDVAVGETWEVVDRADENSVVAEGPLEGRELRSLMQEFERDLLGAAPAAKNGNFPLLVKYIDASQNLSVQVHPDDQGALRIPGAEAKTEAWYIVDVAPGGVLYAGLKPEVRREEFAAIADGPGVLAALLKWDVQAGDCLLVPGGTVHAIGAGVTILEVQQNSDTTYRLWDWGRVGLDGRPRDTHVAQALECIRFGAPEPRPLRPGEHDWIAAGEGLRRATLARSEHFVMNALRIDAPARLSTGSGYEIYALIRGEARLSSPAGDWQMNQGDVWLIPAAAGYHDFSPGSDEIELVQMLHRV